MVIEQNSRIINNIHGSYDFKFVPPGRSSLKIPFTITNTGNAVLSGITVSIKGDDSSHFLLKTLNLEKSLKPKQSTEFAIIFEPSAYGHKRAVVEILNSSEVAKFTFNIGGRAEDRPVIGVRTAAQGEISYAGTGYNYGYLATGSTGTPVTYIISNTGTGTLKNIAVTIEGYDRPQWILDTSSLASTLAPGEETAFSIAFIPSGVEEAKFGAISIVNNSEINPFAFTIRGTNNPN